MNSFIEKQTKAALINAWRFRIRSNGIIFDGKEFRKKLSEFTDEDINNYMIALLNKDHQNIIKSLSSLGIKAKNSKLNIITNEIKKHFPNSEIIYNSNNNTFDVIGNENITLKLIKKDEKYSIQKVDKEDNTNTFNPINPISSTTNSNNKKLTLSNGKPSSKLFINEEN